MSFLIIIALFAVAWIVLILPKQRELRRHNALVASIGVGDEVMTGSGIYGTVVQIDGDIALLQVAPGTEIRVARRAIASKVVDTASVDDSGDEGDGDDHHDDGDEAGETAAERP